MSRVRDRRTCGTHEDKRPRHINVAGWYIVTRAEPCEAGVKDFFAVRDGRPRCFMAAIATPPTAVVTTERVWEVCSPLQFSLANLLPAEWRPVRLRVVRSSRVSCWPGGGAEKLMGCRCIDGGGESGEAGSRRRCSRRWCGAVPLVDSSHTGEVKLMGGSDAAANLIGKGFGRLLGRQWRVISATL